MSVRGISDSTVALIEEVNRLVSERPWPWNRAALVDEIVSGLARIAAEGQWLAIPRIISLVLNSRSEIAQAAANTVKQLRGGVRIQDLGVFDRTFRELSHTNELHRSVQRYVGSHQNH